MSHSFYPLGAIVFSLSLATAAVAADRLQFVDCPRINFFSDACSQVEEPPTYQPPPPPEPLFPPGTVARDTPPALLRLAEDPTLENARAYITLEQARHHRLALVTQLLRAALQGEQRP